MSAVISDRDRELLMHEGVIPRGPAQHDLRMARSFPNTCDWTVTRSGDEDACGKRAVAVLTCWWDGMWITGPCCAYHAHMWGGRDYCELVPLSSLIGNTP